MLRLLVLLLALVATPAPAWWEYGHETVARIAWANTSPATHREIGRMLAQGAVLATPECPVRTIAEASVWADCVKPLKDSSGKSRFGYAYNWHFQNVDVCRPFDLTAPCKDGDCVSAQIERAAALLRSGRRSAGERLQALLFLVHLVGDLHQPLHAGDRGDLGGNRVPAAYGIYAPDRLNLHAVWDGWLAERALSTPPPLVRRYAPGQRRRVQAGSVDDWSRESWQVSRDMAYATALGGDSCGPVPARARLDDATVASLVPTVRKMVTEGGLRLARLLDEAFARRR